MKKLILSLLLFTVIFTGCGKTVDPADPQTYYNLVKDRANELDPELIPELNELVDTIGVKESYDAFIKSLKDTIDIYLAKFPDDNQRVYDGFEENINNFKFSVDTPSVEIKSVIDSYNAADQETQKLITKAVNRVFDFYTEIITKIDEVVNGLPDSQAAVLKDFGQLVQQYIQDNGLNLKDEVTNILNPK